jgi:hypothetical protein
VRAVLYVSGDGLRVVDDETRGLILDQTIEKVSFCAPGTTASVVEVSTNHKCFDQREKF